MMMITIDLKDVRGHAETTGLVSSLLLQTHIVRPLLGFSAESTPFELRYGDTLSTFCAVEPGVSVFHDIRY